MLLHGYASRKESFFYQYSYLSNFFRVTALDMRGFGESEKLKTAFSVADYAEDVKRFCYSQKIEKPHVIAHSFGGRVALKIAGEDSDFFDKMLLVGCAGIKKRRGIAYCSRVAAYKIAKRISPDFARGHFGSKELRTLDGVERQSFYKIVGEDLSDCAKKVKNRTLLVFGNKDRETPLYMGKKLNKYIKNSKLFVLNGTHFCFCEEQNVQRFNALAHNFFGETTNV